MSPETVELLNMLVLLEQIGMQCAICGEARGAENAHAADCALDRLFEKHRLHRRERVKEMARLAGACAVHMAMASPEERYGPIDPNIMDEVLKPCAPRERMAEVVDLKWPDGTPVRVVSLVEDVAFTFEPKLTKEKWHRLLGHLTKWCIEEIDVHLMSFTARNDRIDP